MVSLRPFKQFMQFMQLLTGPDLTHAHDADNTSSLFHLQAELRNVNSFTRCKTLELNFTLRNARKLRQFWDLSETKLTQMIGFENKC